MNPVVICYRRSTRGRDTIVAVHRQGCRDLQRERTQNDAFMLSVTQGDAVAALAMHLYGSVVDEDGYPYIEARHVTVYPCSR